MKAEQDIQEFVHTLEGAKLSDSRRTSMRASLSEYADFHSVKTSTEAEPGVFAREGTSAGRTEGNVANRGHLVSVAEGNRSTKRGAKASPYQTFFGIPMNLIAGLMLALVVGGGTSYAAEGSLPGDTLYPIKKGFNERVSGALTFTTEADARHESALAERRLAETEALAAKGTLDAGVEADLFAEVADHTNRALAALASVEAEGKSHVAADIRTNIDARLAAHGSLMAAVRGEPAFAADATTMAMTAESMESATLANTNAKMSDDVDAEQFAADVDAEMRAEVAGATEASARTMIESAVDTYEKAEANVARADAEVRARVEARLAMSAQALANAKASFEARAYASAYASAEEAIRAGKEVMYFVTAAPKLLLRLGAKVEAQNEVEVERAHSNEGSEPESEENVGVGVENETSVDTPILDVDANVRSNLDLNLQ